MSSRYVKVGLTVLVLCLAFTGLMWATLREGAEYYKYVDEVVADRATWEGRRLQVHGYVVPGSIMRRPESLDYKFKIQRNGSVLDATYSGVVPDTFQDESEVVLKGRLTPHGFETERNGVTAKCPSKYEEAVAIGEAKQGGT
jgi:cytochrome c-type biogenesis protein CcmE